MSENRKSVYPNNSYWQEREKTYTFKYSLYENFSMHPPNYKYLAYLHSLWLSQKVLSALAGDGVDFQKFYDELTRETLSKYIQRSQTIENILTAKKIFSPQKIDDTLERLQVQLVPLDSPHYPQILKNISAPPYLLYIRGNISSVAPFFGVVGSRKISPYAKKVGNFFLPELCEYFTIVSGWAGGCDSLAHEICVQNGKKTVVVFGCGIDVTYPTYNAKLFEKVLAYGWALVSQFPVGTKGSVYTFPMRNEIISGISKGLLVLEAGEKSGTLITARLALEQGRDVFAVPGDIFSKNTAGIHEMLKKWEAKCVKSPADILEEYQYTPTSKTPKIFTSDLQKKLYDTIKYAGNMTLDEMLEQSDMQFWELSAILGIMEISGLLARDISGKYSIVP